VVEFSCAFEAEVFNKFMEKSKEKTVLKSNAVLGKSDFLKTVNWATREI